MSIPPGNVYNVSAPQGARKLGAALHFLVMRLWLGLVLGLLCAAPAHANYSLFCSRHSHLSAEQKDRLLLFSSAVKQVLEASGHRLALISRSGLDLERFQLRYSHAGLSLHASANGPWSVRQLYFSCDEERPMLFDQGLAGFLIDQDNRRQPFISMVFLPEEEEREVEQTARDNAIALKLLGNDYSANAYAFSTRFQNCNQWVAELIAQALGQLPDSGDLRSNAQQWLAAAHYQPTAIQVHNPLIALGGLMVPLVHTIDHPTQNVAAGVYQASMPASLEGFLHRQLPGAIRIEMCMNGSQIVEHRGWSAIPDGCRPEPGDTVLPLS
jgi:hypothetical protein